MRPCARRLLDEEGGADHRGMRSFGSDPSPTPADVMTVESPGSVAPCSLPPRTNGGAGAAAREWRRSPLLFPSWRAFEQASPVEVMGDDDQQGRGREASSRFRGAEASRHQETSPATAHSDWSHLRATATASSGVPPSSASREAGASRRMGVQTMHGVVGVAPVSASDRAGTRHALR